MRNIFSQHLYKCDYNDLETREQMITVDDLVSTGETDIQLAMQAKKIRIRAMQGIKESILTPEQETEAKELAKTVYSKELCALCSARQAIIRRQILLKAKEAIRQEQP